MATDIYPEFDTGPLSWVQSEIDQSLARGLESLTAFARTPGDPAALQRARTHFRQAAGAIQMVSLDALAAYTEEMERQLEHLGQVSAAEAPALVGVVERACQKLRTFLAELVRGAPLVPLNLYAEYEAMQRARGVKISNPTDLFYPDLSVRVPDQGAQYHVPPSHFAGFLVKERRLYQQGLLAWLRGDTAGAAAMREAAEHIEEATPQHAVRTFWWTVAALFDAVCAGTLDNTFTLKQLLARIDLQTRRLIDGSSNVAERLRRETLYFLAISAPASERIRRVQGIYRLKTWLPTGGMEADAAPATDTMQMYRAMREAQGLVSEAKNLWLRLIAGQIDQFPKFRESLQALRDKAAASSYPEMQPLLATLYEGCDSLPVHGVPEPVAMEYATALLFAEDVFTQYGNPIEGLPDQIKAIQARVKAALAGQPLPAFDLPKLAEFSQRAQNRMLLAQVGQSIQTNLRHMEQELDLFFRDPAKREGLLALDKDGKEISGALRILGLTTADQLLATCMTQIAGYASQSGVTGDVKRQHEDFELLAESLSALGFYIEALEQQRPQSEDLIAPLLARQQQRLGLTPEPVPAASEAAAPSMEAAGFASEETASPSTDEAPAAEADASSLEATIEVEIGALQMLGRELRQTPDAAALQQEAQRRVQALSDDAKLIGDAALLDKIKRIREKIEQRAFAGLPDLFDALTASPPEAPSAEAQRLLQVDATQLDAELLDIYLQEALEVLDTVREHRAILAGNPRDHEALRTVRRGFHTLKGSGRMVGLTELGELAYDVEKIHNILLEGSHAATPAVLAMIDVAEHEFRGWVQALIASKTVRPDPLALYAAIHDVAQEIDPSAPDAPRIAAFLEPLKKKQLAAASGIEETAQLPPPVSSTLPAEPPASAEKPADVVAEAWEEQIAATIKALTPTPVEDVVPETVAALAETPPAVSTAAGETPPPEAPAEQSENVNVGEVVLSRVLYDLFTEEAEQHWAVLDYELTLMRFDAYHTPSLAMIRAAHTLGGVHLTAGFPLVAKLAKSLELLLIAVNGLHHEGAAAVPVVARAISGLRVLLDRIRAKEAFTAAEIQETEAIETEVVTLHQRIGKGGHIDAEAVELREAQRDGGETESIGGKPGKPEGGDAPQTAVEETTAQTGSGGFDLSKELAAILAGASAIPAPEPEADVLLTMQDEIDEQLLPLFLEEGADLYKQAGSLLRQLAKTPADQETLLKLKRGLHTLKGSARMAGAMRLGELTHRMETRLEEESARKEPSADCFEILETDLDRIGYVFDKLREGQANAPLPWLTEGDKAEPLQESAAAVPPAVSGKAEGAAASVATAAPKPAQAVPLPVAPAASAIVPRADEGQLRISAARVDRLVNEAGEIIISRTRAEGELRGLKSDLLELTNSVIRLRNHVRVIEIEAESQIQAQLEQMQDLHGDFDPLEFDRYTRLQELTRSIAEGVNDVATVQQAMLGHLDTANMALLSQARLSRDVQQALFSVRTVPFSSVSDRLYRILRSLSKELHKRANLEIKGGQSGLDRAVLEKLVGPLEHLLRNALDHGVESPETRRAAGKAETADITIEVRPAGNEIMIEFADDGAGLDLDRLRKSAIDKGFVARNEAVSDAKLMDLLFRPGFTTSKNVTAVSGRGMGMDIVRNEVVSLGGRIEVSSVPGQGTRFSLYLPLTVAVAQTVLLRGTRDRTWAIPVAMVEQVEHVSESVLAGMYEASYAERRGQQYPFFYFDRLVDCDDTVPETRRYNAVVFLRTGQGQVAIHIDHMLGNQEVVIKNVGSQLVRVPGISGATLLGDGEIVLIVNPIQLSQRADIPPFAVAQKVPVEEAQTLAPTTAKLVLVVDDSLTIRKVTTRLLTREGYAVETARDGFDALTVVGERRPDVILLDIEMPRMDGFEFAKMMKVDEKTRDIPIIMITSRTADKHRMRAKELGIETYLGKPYQEDELLMHIKEALASTPALQH